jgi:hypothetical protein
VAVAGPGGPVVGPTVAGVADEPKAGGLVVVRGAASGGGLVGGRGPWVSR